MGLADEPLLGLAHRGDVIAALIGAEGDIARGIAGLRLQRRVGADLGRRRRLEHRRARVEGEGRAARRRDRRDRRQKPHERLPSLVIAVAHRFGRACGVPDRGAERDEIGADGGERLDLLKPRRIADAGRLENLRPPAHPLARGLERGRDAGLAEHHVIRARLARRHRVVARSQAARADDALELEALDRLGDMTGPDMDAVGAEARGEPHVALDQQRRVMGGGDLQKRRDDALGFGGFGEAHEDAGDVAGAERLGEARREGVEVGRAERGSDEIEARRRA